MPTTCTRCKKGIEEDKEEYCWFCSGHLCKECWEEFGHCGHPEAEKQNDTRRA